MLYVIEFCGKPLLFWCLWTRCMVNTFEKCCHNSGWYLYAGKNRSSKCNLFCLTKIHTYFSTIHRLFLFNGGALKNSQNAVRNNTRIVLISLGSTKKMGCVNTLFSSELNKCGVILNVRSLTNEFKGICWIIVELPQRIYYNTVYDVHSKIVTIHSTLE